MGTRDHRTTQLWRTGGAGAAQTSFSKELEHSVRWTNDASTTSELEQHVTSVNALMHENIELLLARQDQLDELSRKGAELSTLSKAFYQQARTAKRFAMWQEAKWGLALGAASTLIG